MRAQAIAAGIRGHFAGGAMSLGLAGVTAAAFLADRVSGSWVARRCLSESQGHCLRVETIDPGVHNVSYWLAFHRQSVLHGQLWRLVTPSLLNRLGWLHLSVNLLSLLLFAPVAERMLGRRRFLTVYAACGVAAYASLLLWPAALHPYSYVGGSSASIFGTFTAVLVVAAAVQAWPPGSRSVTALTTLYLVAQLPLALCVPYTRTPLLRQIHAVSILTGLVVAGVLTARRVPAVSWRRGSPTPGSVTTPG